MLDKVKNEMKEILNELKNLEFISKAEYHEAEDEDDVSGIWIELAGDDDGWSGIEIGGDLVEDDESILNSRVLTYDLSDERLTAESVYNSIISDMGKEKFESAFIGFQYSKSKDLFLVFVDTEQEGVLPLLTIDNDSEFHRYCFNVYVKNLNDVYTGIDSDMQEDVKQTLYFVFKAIGDVSTYPSSDAIFRSLYHDYGYKYDEELYDSMLSNASSLFEYIYCYHEVEGIETFQFKSALGSVLEGYSFEKNNNKLYFKDNSLFIKYKGFQKYKLLWVDGDKVFVDIGAFSKVVEIEHDYEYSKLNHGVYGYWHGNSGMDITYSRVAFLELYEKLVSSLGLFEANDFIVKMECTGSLGVSFVLEGVAGKGCPFYVNLGYSVLYDNKKMKKNSDLIQVDDMSVSVRFKQDNEDVLVPIIHTIVYEDNDNHGYIVNLVEALSIDAVKTKNAIFEYCDLIRSTYRVNVADGILHDFYRGLAKSHPELIDELDIERVKKVLDSKFKDRMVGVGRGQQVSIWDFYYDEFISNLNFVRVNKRS